MDKVFRKVRVAAIQMKSDNCQIEKNINRATQLVEQAFDKGAQIVVLPEFMPTGYIMTEEIWDSAERNDGKTVQWLKGISKLLGIWIGTSYLEADEEDFYNTFVLANPDGEIAGQVRKNPPASVEAYFTRSGSGKRFIETEFGRIGISICGENIFCNNLTELFYSSVDMVLQPTSAPTLMKKFPFRQKDVEAVYKLIENGPQVTSYKLGVPVVMANKCGDWISPMPGLSPDQHSKFTGQSAIVDYDGSVKARLRREGEGVIVEDVILDPNRKAMTPPRCNGRWSMPMPWFAFLYPFTQKLGEKSYNSNQRRKEQAKTVTMG
ncbi:MAG: carbon-nitrogen hydrolase family protein [Candidatus Thiodiazotropha sp. (ex Monitilora ramsayi)]|nr:carbon-nitrogen hydrolase family protein [Candidatus Thiodiazotropha sp. (ex Monitilora ramsayi)]